MDEDFKWFKIDKISYEQFLQVAVSAAPAGALTAGEVVSPLDVHPTEGKEKVGCQDMIIETSSSAIRMAERLKLRT